MLPTTAGFLSMSTGFSSHVQLHHLVGPIYYYRCTEVLKSKQNCKENKQYFIFSYSLSFVIFASHFPNYLSFFFAVTFQ
jgi:hypothetical protein